METIHPEKVTTDDGTATLRHPLFGDTYHSLHGAATESEHVFIRNGLAAALFTSLSTYIPIRRNNK